LGRKAKPNFSRPSTSSAAVPGTSGGPPATSASRPGSRPGSVASGDESRASTPNARGPATFAAVDEGPAFETYTPLSPLKEAAYRFRIWWLGYMAAMTIQRVVRGRIARAWLHYRIGEPRALARRFAVHAIQRVYRGHVGRQLCARRRLQRVSAAMFIQRAVRHFSHVRDLLMARRRHNAARKLQLAWYKLNSILLSTRVRALVQNKKEAVSMKVGTTAMYFASLRMQVLCVRWLARTRFRKLRALEKKACTMVQALARGMFARRITDAIVGARIQEMRQGRNKALWALTRIVQSFLYRLRHKKMTILRTNSATYVQKMFRGFLARSLDTRLRIQHKLVRDWVTSFKNERVGPLTDSTEVRDFYLTLEPRHQPPPRMERHAKTSLTDLPWSVRNGPLFDNEVMVPDYSRQYADRASALLRDQAPGGGPSAALRSPAPRPKTPPPVPRRKGVTIEPSAPAHAHMLLSSPQARVATPLSAVRLLDDAVDELDAAIDRRMRTVSRGLPAAAGLPREWDADNGAAERSRSAARSRRERRERGEAEPPAPGRSKERPEFGARHEVLDKGLCTHKGDAEARSMDGRSKALLVAADRKAHGGVAPYKGNVRSYRTAGSSKIMVDALDMIGRENRERGYYNEAKL